MTKTRKKTQQRRTTWIIALVVVAIVSAGGYWYYTRYLTPAEATEEPALQTTTVRRGDIIITAAGSGNLMPVTEIALGFRTGGTLTELAVAVGDEVETGQTLARLDDAAAQIQAAQAELNLEQAQGRFEQAQAEAGASAADKLTSAWVNLAQARDALEEAQAWVESTLDPARAWERHIEDEQLAAQRSLEKAEYAYTVAVAQYNLANEGIEDEAQAAEWNLQAAEWTTQQAELALESAHVALDNTVLTAPIAGTIVEVSAEVGESVGANPVLTLADLGTPLVRFYLEESDLNKVAVGHKVTVVFDAYPDREFSGSVIRVAPTLVTVDGTPAVQAWAALDDTENDVMLPAGLTAEVEVIAGEAYKTLLVPVQALRELSPGQYAVFVVEQDGQLKLRPVEVGLRDFANAQILSGLEQGEVISTGTVETE